MQSIRWVVAFLAVALLATDASAQRAGRVQFVSGLAEVERGAQRLTLQLASEVQEGDLVVTGADGHLQLVMIDSAHVSLRPKSRMRIDSYAFDAAQPGAGRALLSLVTGALHAFTGEIVARDRDKFTMRTPLATVGIRGSGNILAHLEETGTINHTLTGAHSVTSLDPQGIQRTLVSYPGQTVQVRLGQAPRFIPTPPSIMSTASPATNAESAAKAESAARTESAAKAESATDRSTPAAQAGTTASEPSTAASTSTGASTSTSTSPSTTTGGGTTAGADAAPIVSTARPSSGAPAIDTSTSTSQATAATVGASIAAADRTYETLLRFFSPLSAGGFEGVLGQSSTGGGGVVLDAAGRLVQVSGARVGTFLAGPGAPPPGYAGATYTGTASFSGGEHRDAFRSPDASVILGRWTGGTVNVADDSGARIAFELGPRSVSYDLTTPTAGGVLGSFSGTATYSLVAATAPTDSAGNVGSVTAASVFANFSARTVSGNFGLAINGMSFSLAGTSDLAPGNPRFAFASSLQNLTIGCTGPCSSLGYLGTMNGQFAGATGQWMSVSYRVNPNRAPNSGFSDYVVGSIALNSSTAPTSGAAAPRSGRIESMSTACGAGGCAAGSPSGRFDGLFRGGPGTFAMPAAVTSEGGYTSIARLASTPSWRAAVVAADMSGASGRAANLPGASALLPATLVFRDGRMGGSRTR